ncbi:hypothetical protein B5S30_g5243 [[Candida] boidinii]|nr:hypothetical protein B5S30_g5243 [[Candida] boidinii]GMF99141.1 unnamed protein product [[Candida] boidinii]
MSQIDNEELLGSIIVESSNYISQSEPEKSLELLLNNFNNFENNAIYLQTLGEAYLELGDVEKAYDFLIKACELDPTGSKSVEKFFYLGQIIGGLDGLNSLKVGVEKLMSQLNFIDELKAKHSNNNNNNNTEQEIILEISNQDESLKLLVNAYHNFNSIRKYLIKKLNQGIFSMIEIWMTDLCMEENAEIECENLINLSIKLDNKNPETLSILSSIRISQQRSNDAKELICESWELFKLKLNNLKSASSKTIQDNEDEEEEEEEEEDVNDINLETMELIQPLITLAKYAIELGLFEIAIEITGSIQNIDENSIESYYLEGFANYLIVKRIQNNISKDEDYLNFNLNFQDLPINNKINENDDSFEFLKESRLSLSNAFKLLQIDSISNETDPELKETVNNLLKQVGGFILKEKDTSGINENNWEEQIELDD